MKTIYVLMEEFCNDGEYDFQVLGVSSSVEKLNEKMNDMIEDLCNVLHDLEWWQSCDSSEAKYRETLAKFKKKWFHGDREERLKGYIDKQIGIVRRELYALIGEDGAENE